MCSQLCPVSRLEKDLDTTWAKIACLCLTMRTICEIRQHSICHSICHSDCRSMCHSICPSICHTHLYMSPVPVILVGRPNKMLCRQWHMLLPTTPAVTTLLQHLTKCLTKRGQSSILSVGLLLMQCILTHLTACGHPCGHPCSHLYVTKLPARFPFVYKAPEHVGAGLEHSHRHAFAALSITQYCWSSVVCLNCCPTTQHKTHQPS